MSLSKTQGKKQDGQHQKSRGSNKKWNNNNNNNNASVRNNHASNDPASKQLDSFTDNPNVTKDLHDRMLFLLGNLIGNIVHARVRGGASYEGVFHGVSTEGDLSIVLKRARKLDDGNANKKINAHPIHNTFMILSKDLLEITATEVDLSITDATAVAAARNTFKTDGDISGKFDTKERELHKWAPTEDENALGLLDEDLEQSGGSWDQFAANEKLFGLKTDFDEEIYTTKLNRSAPGFRDREKRAIEMANEIQKSTTTNVHLLEERGVDINDSGMDEEDLYGAVVREPASNKYVAPALRKPAQQAKKEVKQSNPLNKLITSDLPKAGGSNPSPIANLPTTRRASSERNNTEESADTQEILEAEIASKFKHFARAEKEKLYAKKQALQKKEKDGLLTELKKFHQTFKLNVPVPPDLVPLLSTGKKPTFPAQALRRRSIPEKKQPEQPVKKEESPVKKQPQQPPQQPPQQQQSQPQPPQQQQQQEAPSPTTTAASNSPSFKFNVKASEFKPNPSAPSFVPGGDENGPTTPGKPQPRKIVSGPMTVDEMFTPSFRHEDVDPNKIGPTWPFGNKSYRIQFNHFPHYEEDAFNGYPSPGYAYGYHPQYRYPQYVSGMPQMAVQQPGVAYMSPQFVQNGPISAPIPPSGGPPNMAYSPRMANVSPHGSPFPQGYPSPQRSPMMPQGMQPQVYQYQGGGPMMMHYRPEMMPGMMQRPVMPDAMQYSPQQEDSGSETPPLVN